MASFKFHFLLAEYSCLILVRSHIPCKGIFLQVDDHLACLTRYLHSREQDYSSSGWVNFHSFMFGNLVHVMKVHTGWDAIHILA